MLSAIKRSRTEVVDRRQEMWLKDVDAAHLAR